VECSLYFNTSMPNKTYCVAGCQVQFASDPEYISAESPSFCALHVEFHSGTKGISVC
jgi:hypothetical protein